MPPSSFLATNLPSSPKSAVAFLNNIPEKLKGKLERRHCCAAHSPSYSCSSVHPTRGGETFVQTWARYSAQLWPGVKNQPGGLFPPGKWSCGNVLPAYPVCRERPSNLFKLWCAIGALTDFGSKRHIRTLTDYRLQAWTFLQPVYGYSVESIASICCRVAFLKLSNTRMSNTN